MTSFGCEEQGFATFIAYFVPVQQKGRATEAFLCTMEERIAYGFETRFLITAFSFSSYYLLRVLDVKQKSSLHEA